jgi:hypothetical protein
VLPGKSLSTLSSAIRTALVVLGLVSSSLAGGYAREAGAAAARTSAPALASDAWSRASIGGLGRDVFDLALGAAACAVRSGSNDNLATLTVIDYSRPSTEKRMWVFDLRARELLYEELVAHGSGSGQNLATAFSNEPETHQSSLGLYRTEDTYVGRNGYSLRLRGLDDGFNDRAYERAIVVHGAPYVSHEVVKAQGRLGRSWGCPALREGVAREVIDTVKGNGLLFAYYPDRKWLESSKYLGDCAATSETSSGP